MSSIGKRLRWVVPGLLVVLPLLKLGIHLAVGEGYGYHGDEMYLLACADHLDWGYVDQPPLSVLVLAASRVMFGHAVSAIRILPAVAGALTVFLIGLMVRRLGGGALALAVAMTAAIAAPFYLVVNAYFSMNAFDLLVWALVASILLEIFLGGTERLWWALGVVLGLGLLNKISVVWLAGALSIGLLLSPQRSLLRTRGPWIAAAVAFLTFLPHVIWQVAHGFPTLVFMWNSTQHKIDYSPIAFLQDQLAGMLPVVAPVWVAGLVFFLVLPEGRRFRTFGWAWLAVFALLAFSGASRPYYLAPSYTWLLAAGGVAVEHWLTRRTHRWVSFAGAIALVGYVGLLAIGGLRAAPVVLPVLPEATIAAYSMQTGAGRRVYDTQGIGLLPEFLGYMSGWNEFVDIVAGVHKQLPDADRDATVILAVSYQLAAAIDVLGPSRGLPRASSAHNNYALWGPHGSWDRAAIVVGMSESRLRTWFHKVTRVAETRCDYCRMRPAPVWLVEGLKVTPAELWEHLTYYE